MAFWRSPASWAPGRPQEGALGGKGGVRNRQKKHLSRPGAAPEKKVDRCQPSGGARGLILDPFWLPLGWLFGFSLVIFYLRSNRNLVFEVPGGLFWEPFSAQNGSEKRLRLESGPSDHKNHIKSAAGRSWRPPGLPPKSFERGPKASGRISKSDLKKWTLGPVFEPCRA